MKSEVAKRLKELEDENRRLKQVVTEKELDIQMLKHVASGTEGVASPRRNPYSHNPWYKNRGQVKSTSNDATVTEVQCRHVVDSPLRCSVVSSCSVC